MEMLEDYIIARNQMQNMFVIHYRKLGTLMKMIYAVNSKNNFHGKGDHFEISNS
jgi:hypothetical protein